MGIQNYSNILLYEIKFIKELDYKLMVITPILYVHEILSQWNDTCAWETLTMKDTCACEICNSVQISN